MTIHQNESVIQKIVDYVHSDITFSQEALSTAQLCLLDTIGCALHALDFPASHKLLGPIIPETKIPLGSRILGTSFILDPIQAAFQNGLLIRWLDFNDTWLAKEWGHPSDNFGAILSLADFLSQKQAQEKKSGITLNDVLKLAIKAYEIQGVLAIENSFNQVGFDHVFLVKIASCAVTSLLLGHTKEQTYHALSQCFIDGGPLRTYRHAPNTGSRKSWAAGDATSRGTFFSWITSLGEKGYQTPITTPKWGVQDVILKGKSLDLTIPLQSYVMEHILFKVSYPAEFHSQTAVEAACQLHNLIKDRIQEIDQIMIETHEAAIRIIDKKGPLKNPADRDHCMQYMVAIALLKGNLTAKDYEEESSQDPRIDFLRNKMILKENPEFTQTYFDLNKRAITNQITIKWSSGITTPPIKIEYPMGHRFRRTESKPLILDKFHHNMSSRFSSSEINEIQYLILEADPKEVFIDYLMFKTSRYPR